MNRGYGPVSYRRVEHRMHDQEVAVAERTATLHGHELWYVDSGSGPAVLFIHGLLGSHQNWAHLVDALDDSHRLLAPDLFGHGASAKPMGDYSLGAHAATLRDLLDQLDIDKVTLVGHSFGGGIALQFCYLFPDRVERLVLVASGGLGRSVSPLLRSATLPGAEWVLPVIASRWVQRRRQPGVARLHLAVRRGEPPGLPRHHPVGDRPRRPDGDRARPPADGIPDRHHGGLGNQGPDDPGLARGDRGQGHPRLPGRAVRGRRALPAPGGAGPVRCAAERLYD